MKKCQLEEEEAHNTREEGAGPREVEERERTNISAFAVSFLGFLVAINQPKGMLQLKKKVCVNTHSEGGLCLRTI
jgi:hypothetical protein